MIAFDVAQNVPTERKSIELNFYPRNVPSGTNQRVKCSIGINCGLGIVQTVAAFR